MTDTKKVLMICLGNICRSPIAEAVFRDQLRKKGLTASWQVSSAALIGYHTGKAPDSRAMSVLREKGITDYSHRARPITKSDFDVFDWIFGMDEDNMSALNTMRPTGSRARVELLGKYDPHGMLIIRDPYYDSDATGFQQAYVQCMRCIDAFLNAHEVTAMPGGFPTESASRIASVPKLVGMSLKKKVLMVCLGNSCRSPMAEAAFKDEVVRMKLSGVWEVDSAALLGYHVGQPPEPRAIAALAKAGITDYAHRARQIRKDDFYECDWIFGMDREIVRELCEMQPSDSRATIELLGRYNPDGEITIRDPYFDEHDNGFKEALEQALRSVKVFLERHNNLSEVAV